jgi:hypothetical protein
MWCYNKWNYYDVMKVAYDDSQTAGTTSATSCCVVPKTTRKEVQCTFWLMKILFSGEFAWEFATLGDVANRVRLESGGKLFWERVQNAFIEPNNDIYNHLYFTDDDVFAAQGHMNPSQIINHD